MNNTLLFLKHHWLSVTLIVGVLAAIAFVYKNRSKLMPKEDGPT